MVSQFVRCSGVASDNRHDQTNGTLIVRPSIRHAVIVSSVSNSGADIIRLWGDWVTLQRVAELRRLSKPIWVMAGSVDKEPGQIALEELTQLEDIGVSGIILDESPKLRKEYLQKKMLYGNS